MEFKFNDKKSRKQINHALVHANDTKRSNDEGLTQFRIKRARLADARGVGNGDEINGVMV